MRTTRSADHRVLAASDRLYRALLLGCPPAFRRAYGDEAAQVFRTCCREALRQGGVPAVLRLWPRSVGDLAATAFLEHTTGGGNMSRATLMRVGGLAAIAGGALWLVMTVIEFGGGFLGASGGSTFLNPLHFFGIPSIWLLFGVALVGLHPRLGIRPGWLGALALIVSLVGVVALLVGNLGMGYIWNLNTGIVFDLSAPRPWIEQFDTALYTAAFAGYLVLGLGMLLYGVAAVRQHALPRYNRWVLAMGVLAALQYFFTDMGAPSLLRNTGTPGILVMVAENIIFLFVWSIGWILLGRLLWTESSVPVPAPATARQGA